jgi:hypothetical protein
MEPVFLKLSPLEYDQSSGSVMLGLSIDREPSNLAQNTVANFPPSIERESRSVGHLHIFLPGTVAHKIETTAGFVETVVVTVEACPGLGLGMLNMEYTLSETSILTIRAPTNGPTHRNVSMAVLTPLLAPMPKSTSVRCQAIVGNDNPCVLKKLEHQRWCAFHTDQKVLLHDELLEERKPWHSQVKEEYVYMGNSNEENIKIHNRLQESLALRTIITDSLYAGDIDDGHAAFVDTTCKNRSNVLAQLQHGGSDGKGRVSISSQIDRFMDESKRRQAAPKAPSCFSNELVVNLNSMRYLEAVNGPDPSVYDLETRLEDRFSGSLTAYRGGNLPSIHGKSWRELPQWKWSGKQWRTYYETAGFGDNPPPNQEIVEHMETVRAIHKQRMREPLSAYELGLIRKSASW